MQIQAVIKDIEVLQVSGNLEGEVSAICYDSRNCEKNSLFVAVRGLKSDGHDYIPEAVARGARFVVYEHYTPSPDAVSIRVPDSRRILGIIGKNFYSDPSSHLCLIGVTGTNGKTTVTYLLESILKAAGFNVGVLGTVNYRFKNKVLPAPNTTPESYELQKTLRIMADEGVTHVVMEVSSHAIDLRRVDDCSFDMGIFTNFSQDHLDYHKTLENYFQAKKRFFDEILPSSKKPGKRTMIINYDDLWGQRLLCENKTKLSLRTFGMENPCDITAGTYKLSTEGIQADINIGDRRLSVSSPLIGKFNLYNILAAVAASVSLTVPDDFIQTGIRNLKNVPGRLEKVSDVGEPDVFVDYAHTEDALLRVLQNLSAFKTRKIITVFGCGGDRDRGKRPLMGIAATTWSDLTILTSDNPRTEEPLSIIREIESGIDKDSVKKLLPEKLENDTNGKSYFVIPEREKAIEKAVALAAVGDIVLIAGKGHENYQIIGDRKIAFDDKLVARKSLAAKRHRKEP
ncbi:MAG TPA: UDP-N-acetylmuramoyl-L-alanyl-D-glutamate--2,6-diaminopimelate ligase [Syntrophales bacterium]|nr:UDP-N-acetylmuramoyl-L-alanyl-D-glutamate--2,6-diaminopimelate ligase [Syntrophales bacterium]